MSSINLKTPNQIKIMAKGGQKLKKIRQSLKKSARPGTKLSQIENLAQELIKKAGGQPGFAMVDGYNYATCINLNHGLVHGIPNNTIIKSGDLVTIDVGLYYHGFHTDSAVSFIAGKKKTPLREKLLKAGKVALNQAIQSAKLGNRIGHISQAIQTVIESYGYNVARNLTGHGLGRTLHQAPAIPCFLDKPLTSTPLIKSGLVIAIEAIYMAGSSDTITDPDDLWTIITKDRKDSAMFEHTIAITNSAPVILT